MPLMPEDSFMSHDRSLSPRRMGLPDVPRLTLTKEYDQSELQRVYEPIDDLDGGQVKAQ